MLQIFQTAKNSESFQVNIGIILTIIFLSIWLYFDYNSNVEGSGEVIGKVVYKVKEVDRKLGSNMVWRDVDVESNIYNYDTIRTDNFSKVKVILNDKTEIELDSNSMVVFDLSSNDLNVDFLQGQMQLNNTNAEGEKKKNIKIISGDSEVQLDNSEIKLNKNSGSNLDVDVIKGKAQLAKGDNVQNIQKNEQLRIRGEKIHKEKKQFRLISPVNSQHFLTEKASKEIRFAWESDAKNSSTYIIEIYNISSDKAQKILSEKIKKNNFTTRLKPGKYLWKIFDEKKINFETDNFYVVGENPVKLFTPEDETNFYYQSTPPRVLLSWSKNVFVDYYKLEISKVTNFASLSHGLVTENETTVVDFLEEGKYYYRVKTKTGFPDSVQKISKVKSFTINKKALPDPPNPITPSENYRFTPKSKFIFAWNTIPDYSQYQLQIAKDRQFNSIVHNSKTVERSTSLKDLKEGLYYWKVRGKLTKSDKWIDSNIRTFEIRKKPDIKITLTSPLNQSKIEEGKSRFQWVKVPNIKNYVLEIAKDLEFVEIVKRSSYPKNSAILDLSKPGKYYWRVKAISKYGEESKSKTAIFLLIEKPKVKILFPENNSSVDVIDMDNLTFRWEKLSHVLYYSFELKSIESGKTIINKKRLKNNNFIIDDLTILKRGDYVCEVTAKVSRKNSKPIVAIPAKSNFKIYLSRRAKKEDIEFETPEEVFIK